MTCPAAWSVLRADVALLPLLSLFDRLDGECQGAQRYADRHLVALLVADQGASARRVNRNPAGRRVALDGPDQVVGPAVAQVVDDLDRGALPDQARVCVADDLGPSDHLLQLVDPADQDAAFLLRPRIFVVVLEV